MERTWQSHPLGWRIVEDMLRLPLVQDKIVEYKGGLVPDFEMQHEGCSKRKLREEHEVPATESREIYVPEPEVACAMKKRLKQLRAKAKHMAGE